MQIPGLKASCILPSHYLQQLRSELQRWFQVHTLKTVEHKVNRHDRDHQLIEEEGSTSIHIYMDHMPAGWKAFSTYNHSPSSHTMTFKGKASCAQAHIGLDTLARGPGYIHPDYVKAFKLHTRPCTAQITLGDGQTQLESTEECIMHITLGAYNCKVWLLVLAIPQPYDIILGDEWLREQGARLIFDKQALEIITKKRRSTMPSI